MSKIQVKIYSVYGNETIYPVCEKAKVFVKLLKQKSFTRDDVNCIKELGFEIEVIQEVKKL